MVPQELLVCQEQLGLLGLQAQRVKLDRVDPKDNREALVVLDRPVLLVRLDHKDLREMLVLLGSLVHLVYKVLRALAVNLDQLVLLDSKGNKDPKV